MFKASALYIVIIIALVIGLICSSLIVAAYFYKTQYQKKFRYDVLQNNVSSGVNILLATGDPSYYQGKAIALFDKEADSVLLRKSPWGIFDIGLVKAFVLKDTLLKVFSLANTIDSSKWAALYIIDEDRPIGVSGKTSIKGDVYIPIAGIKEAYVNNNAYQGDKRLVIGTIHHSEKKLPVLEAKRLSQLQGGFDQRPTTDTTWLRSDSVQNSFFSITKSANFGKKVRTFKNIKLGGNIVLYSDTSIILDSSATFTNVIVFAKSVIVKSGFDGSCQLFASDSISVGKNCRFDYPSCLGILRFKSPMIGLQPKISLGDKTTFSGLIFTYEKEQSALKPIMDIGKNVKIIGQVYSQGLVGIHDNAEIAGSVFTTRFLYQSSFTRYENYLINIKIDSKALSPFYLTSELTPVSRKKKEVLQWLESN